MSVASRGSASPLPLRGELFVNLAGTGWGAAVQLLCIPAYVALLGVESYALIAFATSLLLSLKALDLGLSHTINRELARRTASGARVDAAETRELVRTVECAYGALGLVLAGALAAAAPTIATRWFGASTIGAPAATTTVRLIALLVAVQWPLSLYQSALLGLRRSAVMNAFAIAAASLAGGGALALLFWGRRSLDVYFYWQIAVSCAHTLAVGSMVHRSLPATARPARFGTALIGTLRTTMVRVGGLTLSLLLLLQADKLLASRWLPLDAYGYYMLGAAVSSGLAVLGVPVFATLLPRLSALAGGGEHDAVHAEFVRGTKLLMVLVFPAMIACAILARDLLHLWTHDPALASVAAPATAALLVGTGVATLLQLTMALQLAVGHTRTGTIINMLLLAALLPLGAAAARIGAVGVATAWCGLVVVGALAGGALVYRRQLGDGAARWLLADIGGPLLAMLAIVGIAYPWLASPLPLPLAALRLLALGIVLTVAAAAATGLLRPAIRGIRIPLVRRS